jgi:hypothetical protein
MYNEITAWINSGRDYNTGVALYEKYGTSSSQKRLFRLNGPTKKNIECLDYELGKIIKGMKPLALRSAPVHPALAAPAANANIQSQPRVRKKKHPKVQKGQKPTEENQGHQRRPNTPEAESLKNEVISLMKVRDSLHAGLHLVDEETRRENAMQILTVSDEITSIYERLDHYNKHGVLPPAKTKKKAPEKKNYSVMDKAELFKQQSKIRTYVSRYSRLVKEAKTLEAKQKNLDLFSRYTLELAEINERLNK